MTPKLFLVFRASVLDEPEEVLMNLAERLDEWDLHIQVDNIISGLGRCITLSTQDPARDVSKFCLASQNAFRRRGCNVLRIVFDPTKFLEMEGFIFSDPDMETESFYRQKSHDGLAAHITMSLPRLN
ncbi:MAG: hypothetical protein RBR86_01130 [Pseudobdellovibrionaceae bacterium]|jgi:hypothetical protein|nr:hypothetical protein [Pseudobdellovibrionaceae bacterium]